MTRDEFERRYWAHPELKKAELIDGVVYVGSPVSSQHADPDGDLGTWLGVYRSQHPDLRVSHNATVRLAERDEPQPDVLLRRIGPEATSRMHADGMIAGPPELVAEIARSSASYDLHDKKERYRLGGVREYIVWRVDDDAIDWFALEGDEYLPIAPDERGVIRSRVFPGLRLHVPAMLSGDLATVITEQQRGG